MTSKPPRLHSPLNDLLGYQLRRASNALMAELGQDLGRLGLTPTEASVLVLVAANPGVTQTEIGSELSIKRANMAPITARLDALGLVLRQPVDGRAQGLFVTQAGAARADEVRNAMTAHDRKIMALLPKDLRDGLRASLPVFWRQAGR
ncbi:transcriptional regulator, MarR family [Methylobacterium sp. 4-46]|uniref:MarR family winged helix-turn-helix transcriptional regulator n=1 Tax=unclassified Methylobacterium TaxID=2615210 RepID=UPI000152E97C|nr:MULTISPECIES: MarR family winged helix-turn-helix transcriptional regulator [Methylobacterium]ACA17865.1 transcriptional regulator, MarR family [Methylobacterium sp. 4-46]WFT77167.1 MarR family winged helix-turn-helix transcriptional regulator [Methylobacterium nodulans]